MSPSSSFLGLVSFSAIFFAVSLGLSPAIVQAQSSEDRSASVTVSGTVLDDDTGVPLQGATVVLRRGPDATLVTGGATDGEGRFALEGIPVGSYDARISFVGFASEERPALRLSADVPILDLGTVRLVPETAVSEGVEVTARRELMEVQIDRTVFNVQNQVTAVGGSAADVLQDLPSIEVDVDGTISYRGNENVAIHVNGRPTSLTGEALASFLKSLSAESVERVEVIPNPSARYEPDGMAGILNIVLTKNRSAGWSGGFGGGLGTDDAYNGSANVGFQRGGWQLFSTYGYRHNTRDVTGTRLRENLLQSPSVQLTQSTADEYVRQSHAWTTQAEYQMGSQTTLGMQTVLSARDGTEDGRTTSVERILETVDDQFVRLVEGSRTDLGLDARLTVDHVFVTDEHELTAELRYETDWETEDGIYVEHLLQSDGGLGAPFKREEDQTDEVEQEGTLRLDYTRPLGPHALETGYQGSLRRQETDQRFTRVPLNEDEEETRVSTFSFDEHIHAAYGTLSTEVGDVGLQAGVRAEQALTTFWLDATGDVFENDYFSLFPSAFLTYEFTDGQQVRLSYSKRVDRPRLWQLNPIDDNEDPAFRRIGNPFLEPEYVHAFEASYVRHWNRLTLTTSPYFRRTVNEVQWQETFDAEGVTTLTFANAASSNSYGAELIAALSPRSWVRSTLSLNGYRVVTDASNLDADLSNDALAYSGRANLTVQPRTGLDVQVSQYYRSAVDIAGGRIGSRSMTTIGVKQALLSGKATVGLQARDVLGTMGFNLTRRDETFYQETNRDWSARQFSLSFTYNFGGSEPRSRSQDRRGGNDDFGEEGMP